MKNKLLIIGASGHGKVIADIAMKMNQWQDIAFLDDNHEVKSALGLEVIGKTDNIPKYIDDYAFFVGIGSNTTRKKIHEYLEEMGAYIPVLVHPNAIIGKEVKIDIGTVVMAGAIINPCTTIGRGCIINTGATIDHDNIIEDFVHISPGAHLAGTVKVGAGTWIGIGSIVSNNLEITGNCTIGAGGVVVNNITESGVYVGVPVRKK